MQWIRILGAGVLALAGAGPAWAEAPEAAPAEAGQEATAAEALPSAAPDALPFAVPQAITEPPPASVTALVVYRAEPPAQVRLAAWSDALSVAVAPERLEESRGGADTVSNEASLRGVVGSNSAVNVSTGTNIIDGASFSNAAGIPIVIQNSGANVLIQNATVVNLQLR